MNDPILCPICGSEDIIPIEEEYDIEEGFLYVTCRCMNSLCMSDFVVYCEVIVKDANYGGI